MFLEGRIKKYNNAILDCYVFSKGSKLLQKYRNAKK